MPAHAIGDYPEVLLGEANVTVFVASSDLSGITDTEMLEFETGWNNIIIERQTKPLLFANYSINAFNLNP